jgi:hypothetical protein
MSENDDIVKAKRRTKWWHILAAVLAIAILVLVAVRVRDRTILERRLDAVRAAGYPVTFTELDKWYKDVPSAENAAEYVLDAITCLRKLETEQEQQLPWFGRDKMPARTEPLSEAMAGIIDELLENNQEAIEYLRKAGALEHSRYPIDLTRGHATLVPHLSELRSTVRLLCLKAILHAERNEQEAAVEALVSAFGVADSEATTPLLISQMVRQGGQSTAMSALERLVNRTTLDGEHLLRLHETVLAAYDPNAIACGFVGERCMVIQSLRDPRATGLYLAPIVASEGPSLLQLRAAQAVGLIDRLLVRYIDHVDRCLAAMQLPPAERLEVVGELEREHRETVLEHPKLTHFMPTLARHMRNDLARMTRLQVAAVALAVERFRLANNGLPEQLADLVPRFLPEIPADPYDGQPLRYRKLSPGFVIYSIGTDGLDDGGKERPRTRRGQEEPSYDITFIVER